MQIHHIVHWRSGGTTDTPNLISVCPRHHRMHHHGQLGILGDADDPDGVTFTDNRGSPIPLSHPPNPPSEPVPCEPPSPRHPPAA